MRFWRKDKQVTNSSRASPAIWQSMLEMLVCWEHRPAWRARSAALLSLPALPLDPVLESRLWRPTYTRSGRGAAAIPTCEYNLLKYIVEGFRAMLGNC